MTFVLGEPSARETMNASCNFRTTTNFLGLESFDVNFGREVVLNVAPVRDNQVSGPTSSRILSVSSESSWKHPCPKVMKTIFAFRRDWISNKKSSKMVSLDHQMEFQNVFHTVAFCLPDSLVCFAKSRSIPSLPSTTCSERPD